MSAWLEEEELNYVCQSEGVLSDVCQSEEVLRDVLSKGHLLPCSGADAGAVVPAAHQRAGGGAAPAHAHARVHRHPQDGPHIRDRHLPPAVRALVRAFQCCDII